MTELLDLYEQLEALPRMSIEIDPPRAHDANRFVQVNIWSRVPGGKVFLATEFAPEADVSDRGTTAIAQATGKAMGKLLSDMDVLLTLECECGRVYHKKRNGWKGKPTLDQMQGIHVAGDTDGTVGTPSH